MSIARIGHLALLFVCGIGVFAGLLLVSAAALALFETRERD